MSRSSVRPHLPLVPLLATLFFCSGACALIYQLLWLRTLGWIFGVTVYAASTVWATFMAGLALGSISAGRLADRVSHPLRWFGMAEAMIGVTALMTPPVLSGLQRVYVSMYPSLPHSLPALTAIRFAIAFTALIVPTALMGATLPLVVKASAFRESALGRHLGFLYGSNAAGAIAGTIAAGLYLIPQQGIHSTFLTAAALNVIVGGIAVVLSFVSPDPWRQPTDLADPAGRTATDLHPASGRQLAAVLVVFALSGMVSLALEVVWFRVLTLFLRPTVYGFAVMLATILTGVALGSYVVTPMLDRRLRWIPVLAGLELAIALAIVLSFGPLVYLNALSARLSPVLSYVMPEYLVYPFTGSLLAIFPTALLMGMAFPIGMHVWTRQRRGNEDRSAERLALFYSLNVAGAILGSLLAGFLLLPYLGSRVALMLLATVSLGSGLALLGLSGLHRTTRWMTGVVAAAAFGAALWFSPDPFDQFVSQRYPRQQIVWREEGIETTVVVHEDRRGQRSLTVNGNHQASSDAGTTYVHRRIGFLPMALHPDARTALVIGLGGGATAGAVGLHGNTYVDVVELSGAVVRGAAFFKGINYDVLSRPNVHIRIDDGRNYLMLTRRRYDVVTADVIHPIFAGSGNLYSVEYFRMLRNVLNPGGLVVQWIAGTDAEYKIIARTFLSVFPETTVWADGSLFVGSVDPVRLRRSDFERKQQTPGAAEGLQDLGIPTYDALLKTFVAGPQEIAAFVGEGPLLTDDRPLAEYFLSLPRDREPDLSVLKGRVDQYVTPD